MTDWTVDDTARVERINERLVAGSPTVDVGIYFPSNLDENHLHKATIDGMYDGFMRAQDVFEQAGVQLRLLWLKTDAIDHRLLSIHSTEPGSELPPDDDVNFYVERQHRPAVLSTGAVETFETMVEHAPENDRTVYLVRLQNVYMSFYDRVDKRTWQLKTISTGGLSFPGYMYRDTMPHRLRGVISITDLVKETTSWKTIAHELGHKLLNVSHEYREIAPQHEVRADGGLMLYGEGIEIPPDAAGRYHRERLHVSPFIYRQVGGVREWNPEYRDGGCYFDRIYDGMSIVNESDQSA